MIRREWLLGVGLISGGLGAAFGPTADALAQGAPMIGTVAAVKPDAFGAAPGAAEQVLTIGTDLVENQRIRVVSSSRRMTPTRAGFSGSHAKAGLPPIARSRLPVSGRIGNSTWFRVTMKSWTMLL